MKEKRSLIRQVLNIYRSSLLYIMPRISKYGIGRGQWYFLNKLLFEKDGLTQEELSRELVVDSAHTARAVKFLEDKGLICRETNHEDARKKNIFVTKKAQAIKEDYHRLFKDLNALLMEGFTPEEVDLALNFLTRIDNNAKKYLEE